MAYLSISEFRKRTILSSADVDELETIAPDFLTTTLADWSSEIDSRLRKRYASPFASPPPAIILRWLTKLVTRDAYAKRGFNPGSAQDADAISAAAESALAEMKEAADAKDGLFDLPIKQDTADSSGVTKGAPLSYSETSPYRSFDLQVADAAQEDS